MVTAQVMERSPDINAANVLQRVSGVTIQRNTGGDEAYAMIRGLEPRYDNTLINGVKGYQLLMQNRVMYRLMLFRRTYCNV